jgi:hypothetical protein
LIGFLPPKVMDLKRPGEFINRFNRLNSHRTWSVSIK